MKAINCDGTACWHSGSKGKCLICEGQLLMGSFEYIDWTWMWKFKTLCHNFCSFCQHSIIISHIFYLSNMYLCISIHHTVLLIIHFIELEVIYIYIKKIPRKVLAVRSSSFTRSLVRPFVRLFVLSLIHLFIHSCNTRNIL